VINKRCCISILVLAIISLSASSIYALGTGFYTTGRAGLTFDPSGKPITYCLGAGFVLDTAVATDELFNYRLNIGWENSIESGSPFFRKRNTNRVSISNTFGLGVIRNKYIRLWTGPQLDLGCQFKKMAENTFDIFPPLGGIYNMHSMSSTMFFLGFGAVLGININPEKHFTLSFEVGVNTAIGFGRHRDSKQRILVAETSTGIGMMPMLPSRDNADKAFGRIEGFSRLSFIFRVGDIFSQPTL
jgi:hypothetical protein